jgi:zinc transporter
MIETGTAGDTSAVPMWALLLDGSGGARPLSTADVAGWTPGDGVLWLHLDITVPESLSYIEGLHLDPIVAEALSAGETRPRCDPVDDGLNVALRGVNTNPGAEPEDMVALRIWIDGQRIVTTRRRRVLSAFDIRGDLEAGHGPRDSSDFLFQLADKLIERMQAVIDASEERVGQLEEQVLTASSRAFATDLADLRRETVALRRYLAPQREALGRMISARMPWLNEADRSQLREVNDQLTRYIEDLDAVRERSAVLQQELSARLQDELNGRMYVLSIVAAIFLPLGFLTGLLGVNIGGMPGVESKEAFLVFSAALVAVVVIQIVWFKRKGWF